MWVAWLRNHCTEVEKVDPSTYLTVAEPFAEAFLAARGNMATDEAQGRKGTGFQVRAWSCGWMKQAFQRAVLLDTAAKRLPHLTV